MRRASSSAPTSADDLDLQFAVDWMDDQSGVRGAKMLAPNRFAPGQLPLDDRYDIRSGMTNVNDTVMKALRPPSTGGPTTTGRSST